MSMNMLGELKKDKDWTTTLIFKSRQKGNFSTVIYFKLFYPDHIDDDFLLPPNFTGDFTHEPTHPVFRV